MSYERAVANVSLRAISANCARLAAGLSGASRLCAVVKCDGYGHGAVAAARAALSGGASSLAVVTAGELTALREGGVEGAVLVMGPLDGEETRTVLDAGGDVVAWTPEFLEALPDGARVHIKLDTGMGRLGVKDPALAHELVDEAAGRLVAAGVMTHFATADEPGDEHFPLALERFGDFVSQVRERHPGIPAHAANSAATLREPAAHFDMVRCGIAIYGLDPFQGDPADHRLQPALELQSRVASVKPFERGESAGYGRRFIAREPTQLALVPIGYGDGWRRALTNDCDVLIGGRRYPVVGTVSMDSLTVDVGLGGAVEVGEPVVLIGAQGDQRIPAEEIARRLGTINYEITCGIGPRVPRRPV